MGPAWPNFESSEATVRSQSSWSSLPPPTAYPLTRAMIGLPQPRMISERTLVRRFIRAAPAGSEASSHEISPPEQNAFSPAPVRTMTPTARSASAALKAAIRSSSVSSRNALYFSGRLIVIRATPPETS